MAVEGEKLVTFSFFSFDDSINTHTYTWKPHTKTKAIAMDKDGPNISRKSPQSSSSNTNPVSGRVEGWFGTLILHIPMHLPTPIVQRILFADPSLCFIKFIITENFYLNRNNKFK